MHPPGAKPRSSRSWRLFALASLGAAAAAVAAAIPSGRGSGTTEVGARPPAQSSGAPSSSSAPSTADVATSSPIGPTTSTTAGPGSLPQTSQLPTASDPAFQARIQDLWRAIVDDDPAEAMPAFFPLSAYVQVKGISDPVHDYQTRLVPYFYQDIELLHAQLGPGAASATFHSVSVPAAAQWIVPGTEYNKGSYWRVYGTEVTYVSNGVLGGFEITSMISWRGEWYVVHLGRIR